MNDRFRPVLEKTYTLLSWLSLGLLLAPADRRVFVVVPVFAAAAVFFALKPSRLRASPLPRRDLLVHELALLFYFGCRFAEGWPLRQALVDLLRAAHLSPPVAIPLAAVLLGVLSLGALDALMAAVSRFLREHLRGSVWKQGLLCALAVFLCLFVQYAMTEVSCHVSADDLLRPLTVLGNLVVLLTCSTLLTLLLGTWRRSLCLSTVLLALWSIANYYTILFHGSPLYYSELVNAPTAAAVAAEYRYPLAPDVIQILLLLVSQLLFLRRAKDVFSLSLPRPKRWALRAVILLVSLLISWGVSEKLHASLGPWVHWDTNIAERGYVLMSVDDVRKKRDILRKPERYDARDLPSAVPEAGTSARPDIIFILNESLCDLSVYTDLDVDNDPFLALRELDGLRSGYAVTPNIGGGTNNSEFELLMSKSMFLLNGSSPFTYLWDYQLGRGAVSYLKSLGYRTAGMHCELARNYNRDQAYPALGFDEVYLGYDCFPTDEYVGERRWTDGGNYRDMLAYYEAMDAASPRFLYLLTFQNHGGYERCDDALDTVHTGRDFGALTDDINEYLSSVRLSAEAFAALTDSFRDADRDVVICMVGDHAPPLIRSLPPREDWSADELAILQRTVPYYIWANFDLDDQPNADYVSMVDLMPLTLKMSGMPLTPFYRYLLTVHDSLPVRTSTGLYRDASGEIGAYEAGSPYYALLNGYYCLEYNSLQKGEEYRAAYFESAAPEPGSS